MGDNLEGQPDNDVLHGRGGADGLSGGDGVNYIYGGEETMMEDPVVTVTTGWMVATVVTS